MVNVDPASSLSAEHALLSRVNHNPTTIRQPDLEASRPSPDIGRDDQFLVFAALGASDTLAMATTLQFAVLMTKSGRTLEFLAALLCALILGVVGQGLQLYRPRSESAMRHTCAAAIRIGAGLTVCIAGCAWIADSFRTAVFVGGAGLTALLCTASVRLVILNLLRRRVIRLSERVLLVGTPESIGLVADTADIRLTGYISIGDDGDAEHEHAALSTVPCFARLDANILQATDPAAPSVALALVETIAEYGARFDRVVILGAGLESRSIGAVINALEHLPVEISLAPACSPLGECGDALEAGACLTLRRSAMTPAGIALKRGFDLVAACGLTLFLTPLMIMIAALIRLESPGSVLFRQVRWGWNNQPFIVYKFRTMWVDAPCSNGSMQVVRGDRRVTRVGAVLRKTSLDELPQLLNVIRGTMSLVGPRPHPVELNRRFSTLIERYPARHRVRPGMTGLAQVNGLRGETSTCEAMQKRVELDLEYIRTRSLIFDLWILARTVVTVIGGRNAY